MDAFLPQALSTETWAATFAVALPPSTLRTSLQQKVTRATLQSAKCLVDGQRTNGYNERMHKHLKDYKGRIWGRWLHQRSTCSIGAARVVGQATMPPPVEGPISRT